MAGLGELERRVMDVLWGSMGIPNDGGQVADQLPDRAYTTVLTILERLRRKSLVERTMDEKMHHFAATASREYARGRADGRGARGAPRTDGRYLCGLPKW